MSVLAAIKKLLPHENLIYLADTAHTPYGEKETSFVENRVSTIAEFLEKQSVKMIVVACNTATAAAVKTLRQQHDFPIIGLEPALKPAIEASKNKQVGVLATQATLESQKYQELKSRFIDSAQIFEKASPFFVELVESAPLLSDQHLSQIKNELQVFIDNQVDSLVLGCTHFPFLTQAIHQILGDKVKLYESAIPVAKEVQRRLQNNYNSSNDAGRIEYYSSSPEKSQLTFNRLLNQEVTIKNFN